MGKAHLLQSLVDKFSSDLNYYRSSKYNETQLRTDFLDQFFALLGWDIVNSSGKPTNEREVLVEEALNSSGENTKRPDYTFRLFSKRKFFVEAKKPNVNIAVSSESAKQVRRYGFTAKLKISVLSNFEYTAIYDTSNPVKDDDDSTKSRVKLYHYTELVDKFEEIKLLIGRESVYSGQFDEEWSEIELKISKFSIDDLFLKQINSWRILLANDFVKIKKDLDDTSLNDLTQSYINSIVFLRVCEDRDLERYEDLYHFAEKKSCKELICKLQEADKKYNSGLFALEHIQDLINNSNSAVWQIISDLYYPQSTYSFSVFSSDILGNIYEVFLSERVHITDSKNIKLLPKAEHVERDVVTTPSHIIKSIIKNTLVKYCKEKTAKEIFDLKIADIACGSGAFIIEAFQVVQDLLIDYYLLHDHSKVEQISTYTYKLKFSVKKEVLCKCIYGVDKDYNAVSACSFGLLLKLIEGESKETIGMVTPILPNLDKNILFGNSLIDQQDNIKDEDLFSVNPFDINNYQFDVVIGNPPYMATEHMKQITPKEYSIYKKKYKSAFKQFDKYFLFVERSMQILKDGGCLGYILPSKFMKVGAGQKLRKLLTDNKYLCGVISFGSNQIFKSKTTYTCLLFLKKSSQHEFSFCEVTDLKAWFTDDKKNYPANKYKMDQLSSDTWILEKETNLILDRIQQRSATLAEVVGKKNIANGIQTSANPYYIHKMIKSKDGFVYFQYNGMEYKVEEELTRPYYETDRSGHDNFYTYKNVEPNSFVIYPYQKRAEKIKLVSFDKLKSNFPCLFEFLHIVKDYLDNNKRSIKPTPTTKEEWYRYGRSQALENCDVARKIIVGILSNGHKYSIDTNRTFVSSGGTAGYNIINVPEETQYSIFYIQAVLSSKYVEWFASIFGEIFRGGFVARGTKIQERMPVPIINFQDKKQKDKHNRIAALQEEMNDLFGQIENAEERQKIILKRLFASKKDEMDKALKDLFDLGEFDIKIPSVEDLYAGLQPTPNSL
ncbi:Eco57I restriction-modification methylase domain-containing protein [Maridesulfovibrio sp.]|uniref:Eco57I restriction-modification methylase domain-containing protein n=1 Tax=Maridesulfovibrio sp. TaxID=2795000 RepID=UPI0029F566FC|nr:N-6 DNA methylase [Maridesulfovibrio sp.]